MARHPDRSGQTDRQCRRAACGQAERPDPGQQPAGHGRRRGVIPAKFDYVRPGSLAEAVRALAGGGDDAKVIAGGQSLLPLLRLRLAYPELLVDLGGLDELRGVTDAGDALLIGARTTHYQLIHDPLAAEHCGLLAQAAPAGDLPAVALARQATLIASGPGGEREIAAADFFVDYLTSSLEPD